MSLFLDEKYLSSIGHLLRNYKKKQDYLWNFSCPLCGDSRKKKIKARGYMFRYRDTLIFKCHNCGETLSFSEFLKGLDASLYQEYIVETFAEKGKTPTKEEKEERVVHFKKGSDYKSVKPAVLVGSPAISTLGPDHPARAYLEWRKLPPGALQELYWTDDFPALVDKFLPENQYSLVKEGRIVIPFYDTKKELVALQGRSMPIYCAEDDHWYDPSAAIRYITVKADENAPRVFGMQNIKLFSQERIYCVEGPFDSLFLKNCVAMAGSDIPTGYLPKDRAVIVYDNERKKPDTIKKIGRAIKAGYTVCIWPENIKEKDINNMILSGMKIEKIREIIDLNLYSGLQATLQLQHWANPKGLTGKGNGTSLTYKGHSN